MSPCKFGSASVCARDLHQRFRDKDEAVMEVALQQQRICRGGRSVMVNQDYVI
ncbi:hypothetical protein glysoja_017691 [Glycine soja]|nr:hypothetical protein glysoja_017691 [Glycine soja]